MKFIISFILLRTFATQFPNLNGHHCIQIIRGHHTIRNVMHLFQSCHTFVQSVTRTSRRLSSTLDHRLNYRMPTNSSELHTNKLTLLIESEAAVKHEAIGKHFICLRTLPHPVMHFEIPTNFIGTRRVAPHLSPNSNSHISATMKSSGFMSRFWRSGLFDRLISPHFAHFSAFSPHSAALITTNIQQKTSHLMIYIGEFFHHTTILNICINPQFQYSLICRSLLLIQFTAITDTPYKSCAE